MEKTLRIIIVILLVVALGLGYVISKKSPPRPVGIAATPLPSLVAKTSPSPGSPVSTPVLNLDQKLVLDPPPSGSDKEAIGRYFSAVERLAKNEDRIEIGPGCFVDPLVVRIKQGAKFTIKNGDTRDHELNFDGPKSYPIRAGSTETITVSFSHGPGIYAYVCDQTSPGKKIVGVLTVTP
ncbi:MAG: hypothetical protein Q8R40_01700 [bacterium]|nr:hypothetical protein [bacterium]